MHKLHSAILLIVCGLGTVALRAQQPAAPSAPQTHAGAESYAAHCAICHGDQREGILPAFPPLVGIKRQLNDVQIVALLEHGKGRMPAFPRLAGEERTALLAFLDAPAILPVAVSGGTTHGSELSQSGHALFQQNCAFCHGRDAMGGETGPDLTRSKLVAADAGGDKISDVVRNGRPEKKMPAFNFSSSELLSLATWIHEQVAQAASQKGGRRGVEVADLQTGNAEAGRAYFNGKGTCSTCHSPTGDFAGIASRLEGLDLEKRMLFPQGAVSHVTVTLASGEKVTGALAYRDEFTIALRDARGTYRSWPANRIHFAIDAPANAHVALFPAYTDDDVHNLMAYIQTLR